MGLINRLYYFISKPVQCNCVSCTLLLTVKSFIYATYMKGKKIKERSVSLRH